MATVAPPQLDRVALDKLRELDPSGRSRLLERVFDAFGASMQRMLPPLAASLPAGPSTPAELAAQRLIVHTLKSSAATIGALSMARQCGELEALLRDGQTTGVAVRIERVLAEAARVRLAMRALTGHPT